MNPEYLTHTLSNGLRIIHKPTLSPVAYCGYAVNVGTRDEEPGEFGMAHFVEHLLFKGTQKRNSWHILNRMETVGGELNAYTSKEETFVYSTFLETHIERAIELISDLVFHSQFPQAEIEKEVEVILDEINSYKDNPAELIYDEFENLMFANHPLGHNILGEAAHLQSFTTAHGKAFMAKHYTPDNMIFFSMGQTDFKKIVRLLEKLAGAVESAPNLTKRLAPNPTMGQFLRENHDTHQSHVVMGARAYHLHHPNRLALYFINNLLGGPGMNSRLNLALRERHGYVYSVESNLTTYSDTGLITIYFGSDPKNREKCIQLVNKEIRILRDKKLTDLQLSAAKKQMMGQMGISIDNRESLALAMGKSFLHFNRFDSLEQVYTRINQLTTTQLLDVTNEIFDESQLFSLVFE
jgi:predicted Zn-dependent peptidase